MKLTRVCTVEKAFAVLHQDSDCDEEIKAELSIGMIKRQAIICTLAFSVLLSCL